MTFARAVEADREERMVEAAALYEAALEETGLPLDALLDLAILYWEATDYGYWTGNGIPKDFVLRAGPRYREILEMARRQSPQSTAVRFWEKYTAWVEVGDPLEKTFCKGLLREDPTELSPLVFLYSEEDDGEYRELANMLLQRCRERPTFRSRYVASVIAGVMKRAAGRS